MTDYKAKLAEEGTTIERFNGSFIMRVRNNVRLTQDFNTADLEAALCK